MKKLILVVIVLAVGIALGIYFQRQPKTQKIETQLQTDAGQAGVQKVDAVAAEVKAGIQKAGDVATNVLGQVKADAQKLARPRPTRLARSKTSCHEF
jgi:uncharacterized protein HemX